MSIYGKGVMAGGGKKPTPLSVSTNGTWNRDGGYNPVNISVPASAVTSGTKSITANGNYDVTEFKNVNANIPASAVTSGTKVITTNGNYDVTEFKNVNANIPASAVTSGTRIIVAEGVYDVTEFKNARVVIGGSFATTSPIDGLSYVNGLPNNWNTIKEIAKVISEASGSINANTTGSVYVNNGNKWAYKITPGDTINVTSTAGTYAYAVMGFNNFALTNRGNYGGTHTTAGLTFGAVNCMGNYKMNSSDTNSGGWGQCQMRTSTMPTLQSGMPGTLAQVKVPYVDYNNKSTILYSDDYMFLPAEKEVFGTRTFSIEAEANALTQFAYYKNGGSTIKNLSGSAVKWLLRSVGYTFSYFFCLVNAQGNANYFYASEPGGVAPCFCV